MTCISTVVRSHLWCYRMVAAPGLSASRFVRHLSSFADKIQQISSSSCTVIRKMRNRWRLYKSKLLLTFKQVARSCVRILARYRTQKYVLVQAGRPFCCAHCLVGLCSRSGSAPASLWAVCSIWTDCLPVCLRELGCNHLKKSGHYMYRQWSLYVPPVVTICTASLTFNNSTFCKTLYLCVLCGSQNKQRLFPYRTLTDWFV